MDEFDKAVVRHMRSQVTARQNGRTRSIPLREALMAKQSEVALKGNPYAIRRMLELDHRATAREAAERRLRRETWARIELMQEQRYAAALAKGEDTELILPHPDDIAIDAEDARVIGPCDAVELAACRRLMKLRDLLFLQHGLEERLRDAPLKADQGPDKPTSPLLFACFLNQILPRRFQLSRSQALDALWRATSRFTKRQLLTLCHRGWSDLGLRVPRGAALPGLGFCLTLLDITLATVAQIRQADGSRPATEDALEDGEQRIFEELPLGEAGPVPLGVYRRLGVTQ